MPLSGWNTWDTYSVSSVIYADTGLRLRAGVLDPNTGKVSREVLLPHMVPGPDLVGPRTADGSYIEWRIHKDNYRLLLEMTADGPTLIWRIHPEIWPQDQLLAIDLSYPWGKEQSISHSNETWASGGFLVHALTPVSGSSTSDQIVLDLRQSDAIVTVGMAGVPPITASEAEQTLADARRKCVENEFQSSGYLRSAAQALSRGAFWDTIWEPKRDRPLPTFSRDWSEHFGGFVDAPADNFAQAASTGHFHETLSYLNIEEMLTEANSEGMIPNIGAGNGNSDDRSEPPNGSHSALKLYKNFGDKSFLERVFPGLARWNRWWYSHRDGNGDGIFEWGADPVTDPNSRYYGIPGKRRAMWELCADNSIIYEDVDYNEEARTLEMSDVGLNAYLALDAWSLWEMAKILGYEEDAAEFERKYNDLKEKINAELWNDEVGFYINKHWDGRWEYQYEPQMFFTLTAGIVPPDRAKRMIEGFLLNETEFWGEYPLPSISRDNPAFPENSYYRGRIWGEQVHLVTEGLHRYGMDDVAFEMTRRLLRMYLREWEEHSHSHENYNSVTGEGDDVKNATADYAALGGIMGFAAIQQLVDVEAWGGLRFGNLSKDYARVSNVLIGGSRWDVETGERLLVRRDGRTVIESDAPVIVRGLPSPAFSPERIELDIKANGSGTMRIYDIDETIEVVVKSGGVVVSRDGELVVELM